MNFIEQIKKIIAITISISLVLTIVVNDISYANIVNNTSSINDINTFIPKSFGNISKSRYYDSDEIVINIQDLHCHAQTQRQISSIIGYLENKYKIKEVYLEGAYKNIDRTWLSTLTETKIGKEVIENLVEEGRISGTEYYSLINKKENFIKPIEDEKLYKENINLLDEIIKFKDEVEVVCNELEKQIKNIKEEYSSSKAQTLDRLINRYNNKGISAKKYYATLSKIAKKNGIDINLYENLSRYIKYIQDATKIDNKKIGKELQLFLSELKKKVSYQEYVEIIKGSNNLKNIENIIYQIKNLNQQYDISKNLKLNNLESLIKHLEFNDRINSEQLIEEEENLKEDIFTKLGRTKYEREISFLNEFVSKIREYFTANISAKEYNEFEKKYTKFRKIWTSYFEINTVKKLDKYQKILSKYHSNNTKRDIEFSKRIITQDNKKSNIAVENTVLSKENILKELGTKRIKVVVTGGFHTQGLENILELNKISYVVITPKIIQPIEKAKEIYLNTIEYNNTILRNTINLEPLSQEPIDISFPKVMASIFSVAKTSQFKVYSETEILAGIRSFVKEEIIDKQEKKDIIVQDWEIEGDISTDKIIFSVKYNSNGKTEDIKYIYSQGIIKQFTESESELDTDKSSTRHKIELLSITKDIIKTANEKLNVIINILIAPIIEETFFRILPSLPLIITTATITTNPILIIPAIITSIVGTVLFSYSHKLWNELNNWKEFLPQSIVLTSIYLAVLIVFPEQIFLAPIIAIVLHSLNNILVLSKDKIKNVNIRNILSKLKLLTISSQKEKSELDKAIDELEKDIYYSGHNDFYTQILDILKNLPKNKNEKNRILANLIDEVLQKDYDNISKNYYLRDSLINKFISISVLVRDDKNAPMLNHIIDIICSNNINNSSGKFDDLGYAIDKQYSYMLPKISSIKELDSAINLLITTFSEDSEYKNIVIKAQQILEEKSFSTKYNLFVDLLFKLIKRTNKVKTFKLLFKIFNNIKDINLFNKSFDKLLSDYDKEDIEATDIYENKYKKTVEQLISLINIGNSWKTGHYVREISDYLYSNYDIKTDFKVNELKEEKAKQKAKEKAKQKEEQEKRDEALASRQKQKEINILLFEQDKNLDYLEEVYKLIEYLEDYDISKLYKFKELIDLLNSDKFLDSGKYIDMKMVVNLYKKYDPNHLIIPSKNSLMNDLSITSLLKFNAFRREVLQEKPIFIDIENPSIIDEHDEDIQILNSNFDAYRKVLEYNRIAMQQLNSANSISDLLRIEDSITQMIQQFSVLNIEYANIIKSSKDNIFENLKNSKSNDTNKLLKHHKNITYWENTKLQEISNLNSLINAIHQLSRQDFIKSISNLSTYGENKTKVIKVSHDNTKFRHTKGYSYWYVPCSTKLKMYDFSKKVSNIEIIEFLKRLSCIRLPYSVFSNSKLYQIDDFVCKDDILVWSNKLGFHSIDIIFDFSEHNREIRISFTESENSYGNSERIKYFKKVLKQLGFTYDNLKYSLNAHFDGNSTSMNMVDVAVKVVELFKYSPMLDFDLARNQPSDALEKLFEKFMSGHIGYKYSPNQVQGWEKEGQSLLDFNIGKIQINELYAELEYLGLDNYFKNIEETFTKITQPIIDKYFNKVIETAYINGKIKFDKNGFLIRNKDYDIARDLLESYRKDITDTARQARISNIISSSSDETEILGKVGRLYYYGVSRKQLVDGSWILIKKIVDPLTNRARYATSEHVTLTNRIPLRNEELITLLEENGHEIPKQDWNYNWAGTKEQNATKKYLESEVLNIDVPTLFAKTICEGKQNYVVGVLGKDIFVTDVMKQQNMPKMVTSKAVITAIGSELSHMAIEVGERGIPTVSLNGAIVKENDIQTTVYYPIKNNGTLNTQELASRNISLKDGALIGINVQTGEIYLFNTGNDNDDDINIDIKLINKINKCIEKRNIKNLVKLINREKENKKINRIIEYVYFQLSKDIKEKDLLFLFLQSEDISDEIKDKIESLNDFYLKEQFINIEQAIENLKLEKNINIKYTILNNIVSKLNSIVTVGNKQQQQIQEIKDKVSVIEKEIKDELQKWLRINIDKFSHYFDDKDSMKIERFDDVVKFIQQATYYDNFVSQTEEDVYLKQLRLEVISLVERLNKTLNMYFSYYVYSSHYNEAKMLKFEEITPIDVSNLGSKTTELATISKLKDSLGLDFEVPKGIGVGYSFFIDFIGKQGQKMLSAWKQSIENGDILVAKQISQEILNLIEEKRNSSEEFKNKINEFFENIEAQEFSVRSSGVGGEDSPTSSFAGIGLTSLHVKKSDIYDRILDSWKSFFSDEAIEYEINTKQAVFPAVLVQEMIEADISGIINTSNKYGYLEINVGYGAGQGIVADEVSCDYILVDKSDDTAITYNTATKDTMVVRNEAGGTKIVPVDSAKRKIRVLDSKQIKEISEKAKFLEKDSGCPVDIEFSIKDGKYYFLQRRYITKNKVAQITTIIKDKALTILNNYFKNPTINKIHSMFVAPIYEEFGFRFVPFAVAGKLLINPITLSICGLPLLQIVSVLCIGIAIFSYAHQFMDKKINKNEVRNWKQFLVPSTILTVIYLAVSVMFPSSNIIALFITTILHSLNNILVLSKDKIKNINIRNILSKLKLLIVVKEDEISRLEKLISDNPEKFFKMYTDCINAKDGSSEELRACVDFQKQYGYYSFVDSLIACYKCAPKIFDRLLNENVGKDFPKSAGWGEDDYLVFSKKLPFLSPLSYDKLEDFESDLIKKIEEYIEQYKEYTSRDIDTWNYWAEIFIKIKDEKAQQIAYSILRALYKTKVQNYPPDFINYELWNKYIVLDGKENDINNNLSQIILNLKHIEDNYLKYLSSLSVSGIGNGSKNIKSVNIEQTDNKSIVLNLKQTISTLEDKQQDLENIIVVLESITENVNEKEQKKIVEEQLNKFCEIVFDKTVNITILSLMKECLYSVKCSMSENNETLLEYYINKLISSNKIDNIAKTDNDLKFINPMIDDLMNLLFYIYKQNKEFGLYCIRNIFKSFSLRNFVFDSDFVVPKTLNKAIFSLPNGFKEYEYTYEELEDLYLAFGYQFDLVEEKSKNYDRDFFLSPIQTLVQKTPLNKIIERSKIYFRSLKQVDKKSGTNVNYFDELEKVVKYNGLALQELNNSGEESMQYSMKYIKLMIESFKILDKNLGEKATIALQQIENNIAEKNVTEQEMLVLNSWSEDSIDKITTLHTIINAIHQTSIKSLMKTYKNETTSNNQICLKEGNNCLAEITNCSQDKMTLKMKTFLYELFSNCDYNFRFPIFIFNNKLFCTNKIGEHSLDIFIDLDKGINITFNDSGKGDGNKLRVLLFATLFSQIGFDITSLELKYDDSGIPSCSAFFEIPNSIDKVEEYSRIFEKVLKITGWSTNLDFKLEDNYEGKTIFYFLRPSNHRYGYMQIPKISLEDFKTIKNTRIFPKQFEKDNSSSLRYPQQLSIKWNETIKQIQDLEKNFRNRDNIYNKVNEYLGTTKVKKTDYRDTVRSYMLGKLIINKDGILSINSQYDGIRDILSSVEKSTNGKEDVFAKAQLLNLIDYDEFNLKEEGFIGEMIYQTGVMQLDDTNWLSIKSICDRERKRLKCAEVEIVDFEGNRRVLKYDELLSLLKERYPYVKSQSVRNIGEIIKTKKSLQREIPSFKTAMYARGQGICAEQNGYVPLKVTYSEGKIKGNSLWITPYINPENIKEISNCGGIMMTGSGSLSHASITAKEQGKVALLSNGRWVSGNKISIQYYTQEEKRIEDVEIGRNTYHTTKIKSNTVILEEDDVVLVNGITGRMLIFKNIKDVEKLQKLIDEKKVQEIERYIKGNKENNIEEIIEYIFLQTVWQEDKKEIVDMLLNWKAEEVIVNKIKELNESNVVEKISDIENGLNNIESIEEESKARYGVIAEEKANIILTIIMNLKEEIQVIKSLDIEKENKVIELRKGILSKEKEIKRIVLNNIERTIEETNKLLARNVLSEEEENILSKISKKLKVMHNYWHYEGIEELVKEIDKKIIKKETSSERKEYAKEIKGFEQLGLRDIADFGGKTTEIAELSNLFSKEEGIKVPYGKGISKNVLEIFLEEAGNLEEYKDLVNKLEQAIKTKKEKEAILIGEQIGDLILGTNDPNLKEYLSTIFNNKDKKYAVRSSAINEDNPDHAFAGMAKTNLNVSIENIYESVKDCWAAFYSSTCVIDMIKEQVMVKPALSVQEMSPKAKSAGVCFSRDKLGRILEEIVRGYGNGLVSGKIEPDHISVQPGKELIYEYIRALNINIKLDENETGDGLDVVELDKEEVIDRILDIEVIKKLKEICEITEHDSQYPVDIEVSIDENKNVYVLQRRPITTFFSDEKIDFTNMDHKYNVSLEYSKEYDENNVITYISNPNENYEEAVPVYYKNIEGNKITLVVDDRYKGIDIDKELLERINKDEVVRDKLQKQIKRLLLEDDDFGILLFDDNLKISIIEDTKIESNNINKLLSCA